MEHWWAVHAQSQKEELAMRDLKRRGYQVFWPHVSEWGGAGHKAKSRLVKKSYLSRYLFVRTVKESLWGINEALGVSTVVFSPGGEPFPVPDRFMERELLSHADHLGEMHVRPKDSPKSWLNVGDVVRLGESSPLFNFWLEVTKVLDSERAIAIFNGPLFGSPNREIEIHASDVAERHGERKEVAATA